MSHWRKPRSRISSILRAIGTTTILIALTLAVFRWKELKIAFTLYRAESLIRAAEAKARTTTGRLSGEPYASLDLAKTTPEDLGRAQILLLNLPTTPRTEYLQSLIDVGTRNWSQAAEKLSRLAGAKDADANVTNDLGVVFLQIASSDPLYLFK